MTTSTVTNAEALELLADLRLGVELNRHCAPDVEKRLASLDRAIALLQAESTNPVASFGNAGKPIGTIMRRDTGNQFAEHEITLDPAFKYALGSQPRGTVFDLYAKSRSDGALDVALVAAAAWG